MFTTDHVSNCEKKLCHWMKPTIIEFLVILCQVSLKSSRLIQEKKKTELMRLNYSKHTNYTIWRTFACTENRFIWSYIKNTQYQI